jgi:hypothetical protein
MYYFVVDMGYSKEKQDAYRIDNVARLRDLVSSS